MLISFSVENWQCFREKATLSMVASREKQHQERVTKVDKYKMGLLPVAALYGANASGKTKFFNALKFAQKFVVWISQPGSAIHREYFKLDKQCAEQPSKFSFELLIDEICYEFSFAVTERQVVEEKLIKILPNSEKTLYHRKLKEGIQFEDPRLKKDERLKFVAEGTRDNQLFLTNSIDQKVDYFRSIYDWFRQSLVLISPDSLFAGVVDFSVMGETLSKLDTGIANLGEKNIPLEDTQLSEEMRIKLSEGLPEGSQAVIKLHYSGERIYLAKKEGSLLAKKIIPYHKSFEGENIAFEMKDESAGTERMIELLPAFWDLLKRETMKVYFIDELDRCMHTLLTRDFLEAYLNSCTHQTQSQLLFTTHDAFLMDQALLRRDEIWVAEKNEKGCSSLISFGEYKDVRADKDIRKSYLQGRLGGIPKILL